MSRCPCRASKCPAAMQAGPESPRSAPAGLHPPIMPYPWASPRCCQAPRPPTSGAVRSCRLIWEVPSLVQNTFFFRMRPTNCTAELLPQQNCMTRVWRGCGVVSRSAVPPFIAGGSSWTCPTTLHPVGDGQRNAHIAAIRFNGIGTALPDLGALPQGVCPPSPLTIALSALPPGPQQAQTSPTCSTSATTSTMT